MPIYSYTCENCGHSFENVENYHDNRLKICPKCNEASLYQNYSLLHASVKGEPKTLGELAERNSKSMGTYKLQEETRKFVEERDAPKLAPLKKHGVVSENVNTLKEANKTWYNPDGKNLKSELKDVINDKKKARDYILKGKKS